MRIVSLLPSSTEILFAVGAGDDVVGVSFECDYPPEARDRRVVSTSTLPEGLTPAQIDAEVRERAGADLYRLDEGALRELDPDLVVTQDLCAVCAVDVASVDAAMDYLGSGGRVLTVDPATLSEVLESIRTIGAAAGHERAAEKLMAAQRSRLDAAATAVSGRSSPRIAVLEWTDPPFTSGHWVPDMVTAAGAVPALGGSGQRSEQTTWRDVAASGPDTIVVAPCGYHLQAASELAAAVVDAGLLPEDVPIWAVDADAAFVRPGPRIVDGVEVLAGIAYPDVLSPHAEVATRIR